jgi:hypothetical protein
MEADRNRPRRRHDQPLTPAAQLLRWRGICRENRQRIEALEQQCDPMALLETIRWNQAALVNGESEPSTETDRSASNQELNAFLSSLLLLLLLLWRQSRTCQARRIVPKRTYRTRVDPLHTGQQAMQRLELEHPGLYLGSLRKLQRRMGELRVTHADQLIGQQMGAIRDQENSQPDSKKSLRTRRQLDG